MLRNSDKGYGLAAILFHWVIAVMFIAQGALGFTMTDLPIDDPARFQTYQWHKSLGLTILVLTLFRLAWRLANSRPVLPEAMPAWEKRAARLAHIMLYAGLILVPLAGWATVSASPLQVPTLAYNIVLVPHLPLAVSDAAEAFWSFVHESLAKIVMAVAIIHIAAALRHEFILRDGLISRMIRPARE